MPIKKKQKASASKKKASPRTKRSDGNIPDSVVSAIRKYFKLSNKDAIVIGVRIPGEGMAGYLNGHAKDVYKITSRLNDLCISRLDPVEALNELLGQLEGALSGKKK